MADKQDAHWDQGMLTSAPDLALDAVRVAEARLKLLGVGSSSVSIRVDEEIQEAAERVGWLILRDVEGVPAAALAVNPSGEPGIVAGKLVGTGSDAQTFADLRRPPTSVRLDKPIVVVGHDPLDRSTLDAVAEHSNPLLFIVLDGPRREPGPGLADVVAAVKTSAATLRKRGRIVEVLVLPGPQYGDERDTALAGDIGWACGAAQVIRSRTKHRRSILKALDGPGPVPDGMPAESWSAWRRWRPPPEHRGVAILFTGLSGSGKSTVASAVASAIVEDGRRTVTLLDGDVVRRLLSSGLGFTQADRDMNVLRIGFVATEIVRHGGIAICAPIAPFAETRKKVREMVSAHGDFVLVHMATPLAECERRDRKGLYARARSGELPEFTGVSSPYEPPNDADVMLDTSTMPIQAAAGAVLEHLRHGGWIRF
jgi:sulfate adenylyltransferase